MADKKKVGVLIEGDYYEKEIFYYEHRFPEEGIELHFLSRLWGQNQLTFAGHEWKVPFEVRESFENMSDEELRSYSAIIVPSGLRSTSLAHLYAMGTPAGSPVAAFQSWAVAAPSLF